MIVKPASLPGSARLSTPHNTSTGSDITRAFQGSASSARVYRDRSSGGAARRGMSDPLLADTTDPRMSMNQQPDTSHPERHNEEAQWHHPRVDFTDSRVNRNSTVICEFSGLHVGSFCRRCLVWLLNRKCNPPQMSIRSTIAKYYNLFINAQQRIRPTNIMTSASILRTVTCSCLATSYLHHHPPSVYSRTWKVCTHQRLPSRVEVTC